MKRRPSAPPSLPSLPPSLSPPPAAPALAPPGPLPGWALTAAAGVPAAAAVSRAGSGWARGAPGAAMNRPLSAEAEEELEWQVASRRRKAWAKCRSSWQASETEDLSTETTTQDEDEDDEEDLPGTKLPAPAGRGRCAGQGRAIGEVACSVPPGAGTGRPRTLNARVTRASAPACAPGCRLAPLGRAPGRLSEATGCQGRFSCKGVSGWHSL